jgi:hypothetical protein
MIIMVLSDELNTDTGVKGQMLARVALGETRPWTRLLLLLWHVSKVMGLH